MAEETTIFKAIENVFTGDSTIVNLCPGGINLDFAPENTPSTRLVYEDEGTQGSKKHYGGKQWIQNIVFKIYSNDGDVLSAILSQLITLYDKTNLTLVAPLKSGAGHIKIDEIRRYRTPAPNRNDDFSFEYIAEVPYSTVINESI